MRMKTEQRVIMGYLSKHVLLKQYYIYTIILFKKIHAID